jgi:hypothetical protein
MPAVQTTYSNTIAAGLPGQVANGETSNRISRTVEDAAGIAFGKSAWRGTGDHGVTGTPAAGKFMGWVIADHGVQPLPSGVAADIVPQYGSAALLLKGTIWVSTSVAVADGDQVYVTPAGVITNVSTSNVIVPNYFFDDTTAGAAIVRVSNRA